MPSVDDDPMARIRKFFAVAESFTRQTLSARKAGRPLGQSKLAARAGSSEKSARAIAKPEQKPGGRWRLNFL